MTKTQTLAKIALVTLGLYVIISPGLMLILSALFSFQQIQGGFNFLSIIMLLINGIFLAAVIYFLIYKSSHYAKKIVPQTTEPQTSAEPITWLPIAFRLLSLTAGAILMLRFLGNVTGFLQRLIFKINQPMVFDGLGSNIEVFASMLIYLALAIYLLYGAPHFVKWQIKKTLEQCKQTPQPKPTDEI